MSSKKSSFQEDLTQQLKDPEFASAYLMSAIIENDLDFLPIALGDIAKAHGLTKIAEITGINRRTLYKIFDEGGNPSFHIVTRVLKGLGMQLEVKPQKTSKLKRNKIA